MKKRFQWGTAVVAVAVACMGFPSLGAAQTVGYSILPTYEEIRWDDAFGLEDSRLLGVRAAFDFGPYFSLQPFYEWNDDVDLREDLTPPTGEEVADVFDVKLFGAEMRVNFGRGGLVPFVKGGGGILRTDDDIEGRRDRIVLRGGGGIRFAFGDRSGAEIFAERVSTRMSEPFVPGAVDEGDLTEDDIVNSVLFGAGLRLAIGGDSPGATEPAGLLPGVFLEPFASRIDFADEIGMPQQYTVGARGGVDFNRNVGLRAYYWRGVDDEFGDWTDIEGFGGEAEFSLNTGPGLSPFLVVGAGRITPFGDYEDDQGEMRGEQDHFTLGGGVSWALSDRTNIELAARDLLMTTGGEVEDITDPDDLVSNWQYSAGISVAFGASPNRASDRDQAERQDVERELAELREENRRLREGEAPRAVGDTIDIERRGRDMITVPVPEVGEIILRYGEAYAPVGDALTPADSAQAMVDSPEMNEAQIAEAVRAAVRAELDSLGIAPGAAPAPAAPQQPARQPTQPFYEGLALGALIPYTGVELDSDGADRFLLGLQGDLGLFSDNIPIRILPDAVFGVGGGSTTLMLGVNGRFDWDLGTEYDISPFVEAGLAVSDRRLLNANLGYGAEFSVRTGPDPIRLFVQHRGVQAFNEHQFLVGIRLPR